MEYILCLSTIATVAVSAYCSWITAKRSVDNIFWTVAAGCISGFLTTAAICAMLVLIRERPEFVKLTPIEELVLLTTIFGGAAAFVGIIVGCLCLIYRRLTTNSH